MSFKDQKEKAKDCPEVVCEKTDPLGTYRKYTQQSKHMKFSDEEDEDNDTQTSTSTESNKKEKAEEDFYRQCPNNRQSLGYFTWNFLHTMAIYYPTNPSDEEKQKMSSFFDIFGSFYPCKTCASHYQKEIKKYPPKVDNNKTLSIWLCERHNSVNQLLGKEQFDCSFENLEKRWRTGYDHCKNTNQFQ